MCSLNFANEAENRNTLFLPLHVLSVKILLISYKKPLFEFFKFELSKSHNMKIISFYSSYRIYTRETGLSNKMLELLHMHVVESRGTVHNSCLKTTSILLLL